MASPSFFSLRRGKNWMESPSPTQSKLSTGVFFFTLLCRLAKAAEPNIPFSSLSKKTKHTRPRCSGGRARAVSMRVSTPLVLSLAVCLLALPSMTHHMKNAQMAMQDSGASHHAADFGTNAKMSPSAAATTRNSGSTMSAW